MHTPEKSDSNPMKIFANPEVPLVGFLQRIRRIDSSFLPLLPLDIILAVPFSGNAFVKKSAFLLFVAFFDLLAFLVQSERACIKLSIECSFSAVFVQSETSLQS